MKQKPKYPFATIALYGPNDVTTTKIVVGIFRNQPDDPLLKRWVAVGIKGDKDVQRQIRDFLKMYHVREVVGTDGNIGCPHEEGSDYPEGSDCPFCPFWKGKQGSTTK